MRNPIPVLITIGAFAAVIIGWLIFADSEKTRYHQVQQVKASKSDVHLRMSVAYDTGPVESEEYQMQDLNGRSHAEYRITARGGKTYTITSPTTQTYTVPFFFERLVQDGIWKISNRPQRGDINAHYTLAIAQEVQNEHGSRTIKFTDPHYLATTAGRQFQIHLDKNKPTPDLLHLSSTSTADNRYQLLVNDFRAFGTDGFRKKVADVQARVRSGL
ncbi:MAG: hypothetical protein M3N19_04525 [Candidatus Eremiobacteraeota bacterium]|nr:hypothetical protein [Candidatus Eremiobacteraeota bacterium]